MFIKSKIQFFESKSQHFVEVSNAAISCLSSQRYNFLKANHNSVFLYKFKHQLFIKSKIQFFESKSQPVLSVDCITICCLSSQRYNFLKANHNGIMHRTPCVCVVYQVKDTIFWKQITTHLPLWHFQKMLFIKSKIQFFESKSQHPNNHFKNRCRCLSSQRYNFLKANHNIHRYTSNLLMVVYQVKDTIFWKQITTLHWLLSLLIMLFIKSKIQFFESKSQQ